MKGRIKKVFPGGNTSEGFFSYYSYLLEKGFKRIFVVKGGPGVGKSTLMKKIGKRMAELGYDVEFHYCSSDNQSLDGIAVLDAGIVMVDGTAPHIVDPKYPGGLDEIINMGEYWDSEAMQIHVDQIIASTNEVSRHFKRAYRYLSAAKVIADNMTQSLKLSMDFPVLNKDTLLMEKELFGNIAIQIPENNGVMGRVRHLFSCAYTPDGFVDYTDSILQGISRVYYLGGDFGIGRSTLMQKIAHKAMALGLNTEIYHLPLMPEKIGTLIIAELDIALTSSDHFKENNAIVINLDQYVNKGVAAEIAAQVRSDKELLDDLLKRGIACISQAKQEHDVLEQYYVPYMDFEAVGQKCEEIQSRILDLAQCEAQAASRRIFN
ncbi:PRK06851 family protein [Dehalobacter sp. DCM]|uniref:PRK06851 family protein n=1 Tax=Dehalobacter sp. DCM TaxID=2907827 RepID=UPI0030812A5D|nr:PRK06851 family protein [Dehalobacter sp. DCM]